MYADYFRLGPQFKTFFLYFSFSGDAYSSDTLGVGQCAVLAVTSTDKYNLHFGFP